GGTASLRCPEGNLRQETNIVCKQPLVNTLLLFCQVSSSVLLFLTVGVGLTFLEIGHGAFDGVASLIDNPNLIFVL
ncbi:MAG: hypothetical protein ACKO34_02140, partial [Vampirovibrionales bacterium]